MKHLNYLVICCGILLFNSCKTAEILLPKDANASNYQVKGKNGVRWKTKIDFGNYSVKETKKSFPTTRTSNSEIENVSVYNKQRARHKFEFNTINKQSGNLLSVSAIHNLNQSNFDEIRDVLDIFKDIKNREIPSVKNKLDLNPNDYFVGAIVKKTKIMCGNLVFLT